MTFGVTGERWRSAVSAVCVGSVLLRGEERQGLHELLLLRADDAVLRVKHATITGTYSTAALRTTYYARLSKAEFAVRLLFREEALNRANTVEL